MSESHYVPIVGKEVKVGKSPAKQDDRTLQFANYKTASLPVPPKSYAAATKVPSFPMLGNDAYGDCTAVTAAHMEQVWTSYNTPYTPTYEETLDFYWKT